MDDKKRSGPSAFFAKAERKIERVSANKRRGELYNVLHSIRLDFTFPKLNLGTPELLFTMPKPLLG